MIGAAFPSDRRSVLLQELELESGACRHADIIIPSRVSVQDLVEDRPDGGGWSPVAELGYAAGEVYVLSQRRRGVLHHEADRDLIAGQDVEAVVHIAVDRSGGADLDSVAACGDGRNGDLDLGIFPGDDAGSRYGRAAEVYGALGGAEAAGHRS